MMDHQHGWPYALRLATLLGCALMAGLFFAYSVSVMRALAKLPAEQAIRAMQVINLEIVNPVFLIVFVGTIAGCAVILATRVLHIGQPASPFAVAGCLVYLLGSVLVTAAFNIPRNNALALLDAASPASTAAWSVFVSDWTFWNHVRGAAALLATALLALGLG
jgi:uncharacterized membrane protein